MEEIKLLERENKTKEDTLANVVEENKCLQENLVVLEKENYKLKSNIAINDKDLEQNLGDELGILDPRQYNLSPEDYSEEEDGTKVNDDHLFKSIWKLKEV